jgi:hypothetical protein
MPLDSPLAEEQRDSQICSRALFSFWMRNDQVTTTIIRAFAFTVSPEIHELGVSAEARKRQGNTLTGKVQQR